MVAPRYRLIGRGVYSLADAAWLSGVPSRRIRRWTQGYRYIYRGEVRESPPIIAALLPRVEDQPILDFADLLEVRFLNAFRTAGVGWRAIRIAADRAKQLLGRHHPFSTRRFKTDGRTILAEVIGIDGDPALLDLVRDQWAFERVLGPYLYAGIEFNQADEPTRWWPLGSGRAVVIDPARAFGAPIVVREGVPTRILANAVVAEGSVSLAARLYEVSESAIQDAVVFEHRSDSPTS
jgi:uncharacterized protein (DUF433 family)